MARPRNSVPSYLLHNQSGKARAFWTDSAGVRHFRMMPGPFDSPESKSAFALLQLELATTPATTVKASAITVVEMQLAYHQFAETYYVDPAGRIGKELDAIRRSIRPVRLPPSHMKRNASKRVAVRQRPLAERFDHQALSHAVRLACKKANVELFSPYCLRHLRAVELREKYGLEVVRAVLGQSQMSIADLYSRTADEMLARKAAARPQRAGG